MVHATLSARGSACVLNPLIVFAQTLNMDHYLAAEALTELKASWLLLLMPLLLLATNGHKPLLVSSDAN